MFEELKKKILKSSILGSVLLILVGLGLAGWNAIDAFYSVTGYPDFTQLTPDQITEGKLVEFNATESFGCYLEEYERNTKTNAIRTTHYYYIIWSGDENSTDWRYMSAKVPTSYQHELDEMTENTFNEVASQPISLCGKIRKLDSEEYSYFQDYFRQADFTDEEIAEGTLPYYIDCKNKVALSGMYIVLFSVGALLLLWGIVRIVKAAGGGSLKKLRKDMEKAGYSESMADSDYRSATSFDKKGTLKIGRLMTYYITGSDARAIPNNKIMWAYQNTVTHRTNGVKTGTTYNVMIFDEITPKGHTFAVANESIAQDMLNLINTTLPWVVVGYSDDLKKMYNKNRSQFLQLRYNTCQHIAVEPAPAESETGGQP